MNEKITVTFEQPGIYGVKCLPHYGMGMIAMIVVGTPTNEEPARAVTHPGRTKQIFGSKHPRRRQISRGQSHGRRR
jgi:hypothetical protein